MPDSVVVAGLAPHPPIIIPEIGRGEEKQAISTIRAMEELGKAFSQSGLDTLVIITPHGPVFSDAISLAALPELEGDFGQFGARMVGATLKIDLALVNAITERNSGTGIQVVELNRRRYSWYGIRPRLDHGVLVPLYYLRKHGFDAPLVIINIGFLPYLELYRFGKTVAEAASELGRKIGVLASGDLSHRLKPDAPAGYNERGKVFDELLMSKLKSFSVEDILCMPGELIADAGECGLRPVTIMLGSLDEALVEPEVLSYEGPWGVGYGIALFRPVGKGESRVSDIVRQKQAAMALKRRQESFPVSLARTAVEHYVKTGKPFAVEADVPARFTQRAGVFVSIRKEGDLRGCIGTTESTTGSIVDEIIQNAVSAATDDPRFSPVTADELDVLEYSVDILSPPEPVDSVAELEPSKYGVICVKGNKKGLLLPDLPGVNSAREQLSIAKRKAGIDPHDTQVKVYRFTVERFK
ncbi:MAG TPA: AmmeMemoRadiSam system protein A [Firmicutes bacterium]|nr:AmmeMemoRadiSam system protein A [Bacillota bacterium]